MAVTVFLPMSAEGSRKSISGRRAVRENKAEIEIAMPGQDDPAQVLGVGADHVKCNRCTQVDNDAGTAEPGPGGNTVHDTVSAYLGWIVVLDGHTRVGLMRDKNRPGSEIKLGHGGQAFIQRGNDTRNNDAVDLTQFEPRKRKQVPQQHPPFVRGLFVDGAKAPAMEQFVPIEGANGYMRITGIKSKQHKK